MCPPQRLRTHAGGAGPPVPPGALAEASACAVAAPPAPASAPCRDRTSLRGAPDGAGRAAVGSQHCDGGAAIEAETGGGSDAGGAGGLERQLWGAHQPSHNMLRDLAITKPLLARVKVDDGEHVCAGLKELPKLALVQLTQPALHGQKGGQQWREGLGWAG